ncbi:MAG TPA: glycosyltransferase family 2 protein [Anaerolineaceae bacterium]|nr:glycosyltransferase family 2 protein [Anaerolineaceae bacterium]
MGVVKPTLLPTPSNRKSGWPWDEPVPSNEIMKDNQHWPRISIVTPSFNQGDYLEETIRSVLLQGYPNLEYLVIDGGSTDNSVEIIQKYSPWISYWVSETDRGQAHAINKGFEKSTGDLLGWINSDDLLLPGALFQFGNAHLRQPENILAGDVINFSNDGKQKRIRQKNITFRNMVLIDQSPMVWHQPGIYAPRTIVKKSGMLDESFRYFFDLDWILRLLKHASVIYLQYQVAKFRVHPTSKTVAERLKWLPEMEKVVTRYWDDVDGINKNKIRSHFELVHASINLGIGEWNRAEGISHLRSSAKLYFPTVLSPFYLQLVLRSFLSLEILKTIRIVFPRKIL